MTAIVRLALFGLLLFSSGAYAAEFEPLVTDGEVRTLAFPVWLLKIKSLQKDLARYHGVDEPLVGIVKYQLHEQQSERQMLRQFAHYVSKWTAEVVGVRMNRSPSDRLFSRGFVSEETSMEKEDMVAVDALSDEILKEVARFNQFEFYTFWYSGEAYFNFGFSGWMIVNKEAKEILFAGVSSTEQ